MNKPIYTGIPEEERNIDIKEMWRRGYIPFAGYLANGCAFPGQAWSEIFKRYCRIKKIVMPDEFVRFVDIYITKHPELSVSTRLRDDKYLYSEFGAVWLDGYVQPLTKLVGYKVDINPKTPHQQWLAMNGLISELKRNCVTKMEH